VCWLAGPEVCPEVWWSVILQARKTQASSPASLPRYCDLSVAPTAKGGLAGDVLSAAQDGAAVCLSPAPLWDF
jgi:hypothetical protein